MPPKPWEKSAAPQQSTVDTSEIISGSASGANSLNPSSTLSSSAYGTSSSSTADPFGLTTGTNTSSLTGNNTSSAYGSSMAGSSYGGYGSSYGSGYGGYGGYGSSYGGMGGYGSSYGGYGGYGGSYGMGGYGSYGGYGGYGRMGMGMGMMGRNGQGGKNKMEEMFRFLDSSTYMVGSLCEMARNIEMNADGLARLWMSFTNIVKRVIGFFVNSGRFSRDMFLKLCGIVKRIFTDKAFLKGLLLSSNSKSKMTVYNKLMKIFVLILGLSFVAPMFRKVGV